MKAMSNVMRVNDLGQRKHARARSNQHQILLHIMPKSTVSAYILFKSRNKSDADKNQKYSEPNEWNGKNAAVRS